MPSDNNPTADAEHPDTASIPPTERPLNRRLRPQRLFQKIQIAMEMVRKKTKDPEQTTLAQWLSEDDLEHFHLAVRSIIKKQYDATFDTWPTRVPHEYLPDVREAIIQAINKGITEKWQMFDLSKMDGGEERYDDFVADDFIKPLFWTN